MAEPAPNLPVCFDYLRVAREAGVSPSDVATLERIVRADYPTDDMLYELRLLRVFSAIRSGRVTPAQAIADMTEESSAA
ncbi:MAG: hypothetical protein KJZ69_12535 [Phycisphaerales bacterium]|nr:hypothetical protein [Phycisphaerales bacterium]